MVRRRRMVRNYDPRQPVSRATLDDLVDLGRRAPSAGFSQGHQFLVLDEPGAVAAYWQVTADASAVNTWLQGMQSAPAIIVVFSDKGRYLDRYAEPDKGWTDRDEGRWAIPYWHVDAGMAAVLILLGAVDAGLGACFFGVPQPAWPALRDAFGAPEQLTPVGAITIGVPAADRLSPSLRRGHRPRRDVVHYGRFRH